MPDTRILFDDGVSKTSHVSHDKPLPVIIKDRTYSAAAKWVVHRLVFNGHHLKLLDANPNRLGFIIFNRDKTFPLAFDISGESLPTLDDGLPILPGESQRFEGAYAPQGEIYAYGNHAARVTVWEAVRE